MTEQELVDYFTPPGTASKSQPHKDISAAALAFARVVLANVPNTRSQKIALDTIGEARLIAIQSLDAGSTHPSQQIEAEVEKRRPK